MQKFIIYSSLILFIVLFLFCCNSKEQPINDKILISKEKAIEQANTALKNEGIDLKKYEQSIRFNEKKNEWIVSYDLDLKPRPVGGSIIVFINAQTGKHLLVHSD